MKDRGGFRLRRVVQTAAMGKGVTLIFRDYLYI